MQGIAVTFRTRRSNPPRPGTAEQACRGGIKIRRIPLWALPLLLAGALVAAVAQPANAGVNVDAGRAASASGYHAGPTPRQLEVAIYNIYLGTTFVPLLTAPTLPELIRRAGLAYDQVVSTDFPSRAKAISGLLNKDQPEIVGLQEAVLWKKGPIDGELHTTFDFLQILLGELNAKGLRYRAVAINTTSSMTLPISATEQVSFTDRNVILVRDDVPVSNSQSHIFQAKLVVPTPSGVTVTALAGWSTVDVRLPGGSVQRVANAHLQAGAPPIRNAQSQELYGALAQSPYPVIAVGDFNATSTEPPYATFTTGGYADAWQAVTGPQSGFTCCQANDLRNPISALNQRIDYVFYQPGQLAALHAHLIGEELGDRTRNGLWPSDHAGLMVRLRLS